MKNIMLSGWNPFKILRFAAGIAIIAQGIYLHEWILVITGAIFALATLLNQGCCTNNTCYRQDNTAVNRPVDETSFEEVV